jgi:phospholipid/cholesterol/gamma-HCH transport system permease protein
MQDFFEIVGKKVINFVGELGEIVLLLLNIIKYLPRVIKDRWLIIEQMGIVGSDSLPLVILIGSFTGAIAALEATSIFAKFNLLNMAKGYIGASIATAVFTELTPVLTALIIAGRVGGAMAAQIGTMKVSEQIDALDMMAIDKIRFLAMPRVVATLFMMPVLAVFSAVVALAGAFIITDAKFGLTYYEFFDSIIRYFSMAEVNMCLLKSFVFGGVAALISCHVGFRTQGGAEGVGKSTVRAFTISAAAILIIDALMGGIF